MNEYPVLRMLDMFGIKPASISDAQKGYRNTIFPVGLADGNIVALTFHKSEPDALNRIRRANTVSTYAYKHGLPTKRQIDPRLIVLSAGEKKIYAGLYSYLPGETIPWEAYTKRHIKLLGMALGKLHSNLAGYGGVYALDSVYGEYRAILHRMIGYFGDESVSAAIKSKLSIKINVDINVYVDLMSMLDTNGEKHVLHMDLVRGNVLFGAATQDDNLKIDNLAISGLLDFEKTAAGAKIVDIARTLAFLLVDCKFKSSEKITKYFLRSGYLKRGGFKTTENLGQLENLVEMFLIYDLYKFLRHNPYESLHENEHYIRTRDILLDKNVISYA